VYTNEMKMNENTNGQFITIFKRTNNLQYISEQTQSEKTTNHTSLVSTNVYRNNTQNTRRRNLTAISRPPRGFHRNTFSRFQTDLLACSNRSKRPKLFIP